LRRNSEPAVGAGNGTSAKGGASGAVGLFGVTLPFFRVARVARRGRPRRSGGTRAIGAS
jgi:hypothetical protein